MGWPAFVNDPEEMTADERFTELAAIFAAGYARMRERMAMIAPDPRAHVFTEKGLDRSGQPRPLSVEGLTGGDPDPVEVSE